ncbi:MAG: amino acid permease [Nevskiales bacterium]|nr:amino acid permease [Nevskiales bacterium]
MHLLRTKTIQRDLAADTGLKRDLTAFNLTMLGIGAIIGAGIFVLTGISAATQAGPAVVLSFVISGVACTCAALAYAELASSVGGCGSAYGYGYALLGEFPAWIIDWLLIAEYCVAIAAVSAGWSGYFNNALQALGLGLPEVLMHSPLDATTPGLINLPAASIIVVLGILLAGGAKISARFNEIMVLVKLAAIGLFIAVALFHVNPETWTPFIPPVERLPDGAAGFNFEMRLMDWIKQALGFDAEATRFGLAGVVSGAAIVFFAYIGFDAVSTAAEETRNPKRDLPIGILGSLVICTLLYIVVSGLLTGIVNYRELNVPSPVAHALLQIGQKWAAGMISVGAIAGLTTVMLVLYYAITRIFFAIARDGLLPQFFAAISDKTRSPVRCIVLIGIVMTLMGGFIPLGQLAELCNISTLAAFAVVCAGVVILRRTQPDLPRAFTTPFSPLIPLTGIGFCLWLMLALPILTWLAFGIWLLIGITIYFAYSYSNSALARRS